MRRLLLLLRCRSTTLALTAQSAQLFVSQSEKNPQISKMGLTFVCLNGTKFARGIARIRAFRNSSLRGSENECTFVPDL